MTQPYSIPQRITIEFNNDSIRGYAFLNSLRAAAIEIEELSIERESDDLFSMYSGRKRYSVWTNDKIKVTFRADLFTLAEHSKRAAEATAIEQQPAQITEGKRLLGPAKSG